MRSLNGEQSLYDKMLQESINSAGSATEENLTYMNSIAAQQQVLTASFQEFALTAGDVAITPIYRELLDLLTGLANAGTNFVERFGFLPPLFATLGVATFAFSGGLRKLLTDTQLLGNAKAGLQLRMEALNVSMKRAQTTAAVQTAGLTGLTRVTRGASIAVQTLGTSFKSLLITTGAGIGFVVLTTLIGKFIEKTAQASAEQRELEQQTQELTHSYKTNRREIESLVSEYEKLDSITQRNTEEQNRYVEVSNRLAELMPSIVEGKDEEGNARLRNVDAINAEISALQELAIVDAQVFIDSFAEVEKDILSRIENIKTQMSDLLADQEVKDSGFFENMGILLAGGSVVPGDRPKADEITDPELMKEALLLQRQQDAAQRELTDAYFEFSNAIATRDGMTRQLNETEQMHIQSIIDEKGYTQEAIDAIELYSGTLARVAPAIRGAFSGSEIESFSNKQIQAVNNLSEVLVKQKNGVTNLDSEIDKYTQALVNSGFESSQVDAIVRDMTQSIVDEEAAMLAAAEATDENADSVDQLMKKYDEATSNIKSLNGVINELNEGNGVSADTISTLMEKYPHLLAYINDEAELRKYVQQEIENEAKISQQAVIEKMSHNEQFYNQMLKANATFYNDVADNYNIDLRNFTSLAQAKAEVENRLLKSLASAWGAYYRTQADGTAKLYVQNDSLVRGAMQGSAEANSVLSQMRDQVNAYNSIISGLNSVAVGAIGVNFSGIGLSRPKSSSSGGSSSSKKESDAARKAEEAQRRVLEVVLAQIEAYERKTDALNDDIAHEEYYASKYEETSHQFRQRQKNIAQLMKQQADYQKQSISYIESQLKSNKKLNTEQRRELEATLIQTRQTYYSTLSSIDSINKEILQSYQTIADELVEIYKEAYEKQKQIAIEVNENELKILQDAHNKKLAMLDEEMSHYEKLINAKLKSMDKDRENANHAEQLAEMQKERMEIERQIRLFSMDDSMEGRNRVRDLQEQLRDVEKEISDFNSEREYELRRESLQDQLEDKREQIDAERELENSNFEQQQDQLEKDREIIEQYYEDLLNDERKFAQIRQQILNDNTTNISNTMKSFAKDIRDNMETIGSSISRNLLDKLAEAQKLLSGIKFTSGSSIVNTPGGMASFDTGGYTGRFKGGRLGVFHEEELILNKQDTKDFMKYNSMVNRLLPRIPNFSGLKTTNNNQKQVTLSPTFQYLIQGQFDESLAKKYTDHTMRELKNGLQPLGVQFR